MNPVPAKNILEKGRLSPGGIIAINKKTGDILKNSEIDSELKANKPYRRWMKENAVYVESTIEQFEGKGLVQMDEQDFLLATRIFFFIPRGESNNFKKPWCCCRGTHRFHG